jgi:uncharacterized membrane protein
MTGGHRGIKARLQISQLAQLTDHPLAGTAPLFVLPLTSLFLREVEALTTSILVGTLLIVAGVMLLTAF